VKNQWEKRAKELPLLEDVREKPSTLNVDDVAEGRIM